MSRAELLIDDAAITANVETLRQRAAPAAFMAVVKADGYGHGLLEAARAARAGGADWLGAAVLEEALALRADGDTGRILTWLAVPGESYLEAIDAGIDLTASSRWQLAEIVAQAAQVEQAALVQLKVDTGLSRNGATLDDWEDLVADAVDARDAGAITVTGIWSHLACADEPDHPSNAEQEAVFARALEIAAGFDVDPPLRHLANSPATLTRPSVHLDLVRCGIATYGISPVPQLGDPAAYGLRPAMTLRTRLAGTKRVAAGAGVSYGHTYRVPQPTTLGLVPLGYADGIPRHASNRADVWVAGGRRPMLGRVCMDQFVVDLGESGAQPGDEVVLFGPGDRGEPTAQDWADACDTIAYEIVTRLGGRAIRRHVSEDRGR